MNATKPLFKSMEGTVSPQNLEENLGMGRDISSSFIGSSQPRGKTSAILPFLGRSGEQIMDRTGVSSV